MEFQDRARNIQLLIMDCDGVLTDGRLYFGPGGEELKVFFVRDGHGLVAWHNAGFSSGIISGRNSPIVQTRAMELGIEFVQQGIRDKKAAFRQMTADAGVTPEQVAFIGDDTPDLQLMPLVGLSVAVGDAHETVRETAEYVTRMPGGRGAVRELIDLLLDAKK
jgi:3-deoxy-D-manno-octulosonate 8-phosphate phosphatase (KDO 8-P phosphatase)